MNKLIIISLGLVLSGVTYFIPMRDAQDLSCVTAQATDIDSDAVYVDRQRTDHGWPFVFYVNQNAEGDCEFNNGALSQPADGGVQVLGLVGDLFVWVGISFLANAGIKYVRRTAA